MPRPASSKLGPRRERARAATIDEIKQTALTLMRDTGGVDVRFTDIARAMDLTPPALYRYFADRDALLNALIADAYADLGAAVAAARDAVPVDDPWGRFVAIGQAYRLWARREPQRFSLILGLPLPGYVAPEDGPTTVAARGAMSQLAVVFVEAQRRGVLRPPAIAAVHPAFAEHTRQKHLAHDVAPEIFQAMIHCWASLHGFTTLEAYGHLDWIDAAAREELFAGQLRLAARASGMPVPPD